MKAFGECSLGIRFQVQEIIFNKNEIITYCDFTNCPWKGDCKEEVIGQVVYQIEPKTPKKPMEGRL